MSYVGTWEWAEATNGRLRRRDRADQLLRAALSRLPAPWRREVVGDGPAPELPDAPDSALARLAEERVRELSAPELYGHCLRTWAFAALYAARDRVDHDAELLYLACILHDLGLTKAHDGREPTAECFAVEGARAARDLLHEHAAPDDRARTVAEAISLHMNVSVPARLGAEAYLLGRGVTLDVVGGGLAALPRAPVEFVVGRWPRDGFADHLAAAMERQARIRPDSRAALLWRLGFGRYVRANPLDRP